MKVNISNYKYYPWHSIKSINQFFNWDAYFNERVIKQNKLKERIKTGFATSIYKQELSTLESEIKSENARWDSVLPIICEFFNSDIEDVRTFISAQSSVFKIPKEEVKPKLNKLMNWIKDFTILKQLLSISELYSYSYQLNTECGIWRFIDQNIDINSRFDKIKDFLCIDHDDLFELIKIDAMYFKSVLSNDQFLEKRILALASTLNLKLDDFLGMLHKHPYLIHLAPHKINHNLDWMEKRFNCERLDLLKLMHDHPPIIYWYVNSFGYIYKKCGYSFSKFYNDLDTFKKVVIRFFENDFC